MAVRVGDGVLGTVCPAAVAEMELCGSLPSVQNIKLEGARRVLENADTSIIESATMTSPVSVGTPFLFTQNARCVRSKNTLGLYDGFFRAEFKLDFSNQ